VTATGVVINRKIGNSVAWGKFFAPVVNFVKTALEIIAALFGAYAMVIRNLILLLRKDARLFLWMGGFYFAYLLLYKFAGPYLVAASLRSRYSI
jgi:hypothetical protein